LARQGTTEANILLAGLGAAGHGMAGQGKELLRPIFSGRGKAWLGSARLGKAWNY